MISKVKDMMAVSERLDGVSARVKSLDADISAHSEGIAAFRKEVGVLRSELKETAEGISGFCSAMLSELDGLRQLREDLKKELFDFKMIKSDIRSNLVSGLTEDFRSQLREETRKLDTDVKAFNSLKDELSVLVTKFRGAEAEIDKFRSIASGISAADFELSRYAREVAKADQEKLRLMQKVDQLERLVSKMRRSR